ncbi:hypothetical protein MML48_3g00020365 [Holotrichia oblita]|uniref:Uncharacterized protein n=1 Tax=Holotrichia oblita TaxID=644536 RepID=A0ACB9TG32_HOLOL|nr:hypothetical protein MML48_3g00020365 [Holotrichia oblita]
MGNLISCEQCTAASEASVFTFSDPLVLKLTEGIRPEDQQKHGQVRDIKDREWMDKIQCIEELHTNAYGLSLEGVNELCRRLEQHLDKMNDVNALKHEVEKCYRKHPGQTLQCREQVQEFEDHIDLGRLKTIKKKFHSDSGKDT